MPNENVLLGMRCPKCGSCEPFTICAEVMCTVNDDGTDDYGDVQWNDTSYCRCHGCDFVGTVNDFTKNP